ncbi:MAG TPA: hypothetical protein VG757_03325 [Devosia sp.]|nr:hypothetical protein [Devosia sp.]
MKDPTTTFRVENLSKRDLIVAIEPWAQAITLAPRGQIKFTYPNNEYAQLDISYSDDGSTTVGLMYADITYSHDGEEVTWHWPHELF